MPNPSPLLALLLLLPSGASALASSAQAPERLRVERSGNTSALSIPGGGVFHRTRAVVTTTRLGWLEL